MYKNKQCETLFDEIHRNILETLQNSHEIQDADLINKLILSSKIFKNKDGTEDYLSITDIANSIED